MDGIIFSPSQVRLTLFLFSFLKCPTRLSVFVAIKEFNNDPRPQVDGDHAQKAASAAATAAAAAAVAAAAHLNDDIDEDDDEDEDEDEDEEQDEDDEEDDDEEEDSHHRGRLRRGVGQSRWYMEVRPVVFPKKYELNRAKDGWNRPS